jgi:2-amino-4-hydroxy-6-hydroxymethyldihydropteridine diphosphokinase
METVYLLLGGNIGDREEIINNAIALLNSKAGTVIQASSFYETEPWGMLNAQFFLNIAIKLSTLLTPTELLKVILSIEENLGRIRNPLSTEYESRPIDIDILFYGTTVIDTTRLVVPHPLLHSRKFVLTPLSEIASDFIHPVFNKSIFTLLKECPDELETVALKPYIL